MKSIRRGLSTPSPTFTTNTLNTYTYKKVLIVQRILKFYTLSTPLIVIVVFN